MRVILFFLLFLPFVISAQTNELNGRIVVLSSSGTDPNFTVSASFSSTMGFSASEVIVGDIVVARHVSGATHRRNLYEITSVIASGSNLTLGVTRLSGISTPFFPAGTHAIVRKTNSGLLYDAANVSQEIESYTTNYNLGLLDGFKIDTVTISSDTLVVALENGTEFSAIIPGGSGGANLSSSATSNDVTIISDSGTDAIIQAATASQAGVITTAGYNLLMSTITSFSGDVTGVISLQNASLDINANVITSVELADNSVGTTEIQANAVTLTKLVDAPAFSILGNNTGSTADPLYMTAAQAQAVLSVDDLIALSGIPEGVQHNGAFTGSTIPDNQSTKAALQALETGVEGKLSTSLTSGQILVGSGSNIATARTMSGDGTISNAGILTVTKQNRLLFMDESSALGTLGTVDTVKFTGPGVTASRASNTVSVYIPGGGGGGDGIDSLTSVNNTISITEINPDHYDIDVNVLGLRTLIDTCYAVTISGGNTGSQLWVCANGAGVTASWASNVLTIASTTNVKVKSADWRLVATDISSLADAGGVSNWVQVKFTNTRGNTGLTDLRIPAVQKVAIPGSGALSVTNAASIDIDNNPVNSVVGVASNSVTIRVGGIVAAGQGYYLKFTGIH